MELEQQLFLWFIVILVVMCIAWAWVSCVCAISQVATDIRVTVAEIRSDTRVMDRRMERLENRMDGLREEV